MSGRSSTVLVTAKSGPRNFGRGTSAVNPFGAYALDFSSLPMVTGLDTALFDIEDELR